MNSPRLRIAVLRNPAASANRGRAPGPVPEGIEVLSPGGLTALDAALADLAVRGCDLLVVDGGDGTVHHAVTRLPELFDTPPVLGILAHGNTNLVARKLGRITDLACLCDLTSDDLVTHSKPAPVLRLEARGRPTLRGFIAGWGAYSTGTRIAISEIEARGQGQIVRAVLATLSRALFGSEAAQLRAGISASITLVGHRLEPGNRFIGITTVLRGSLIAGINPFWGGGDGPLRWLDVRAPAPRLWLVAPLVLLGRATGWMRDAGYRSGRTTRIDLTGVEHLVLDGEQLVFDRGTPLRLTATETIRVLAV